MIACHPPFYERGRAQIFDRTSDSDQLNTPHRHLMSASNDTNRTGVTFSISGTRCRTDGGLQPIFISGELAVDPDSGTPSPGDDSQPRVILQRTPTYPFDLRQYAVPRKVLAGFA